MAEEEHFFKFLSLKSFKSYLLELNCSVINKVQTNSNTRVEIFSIIDSIMDVIQKRFPTLAVNIFNNLDGQSLVNFKDTNKENYEFMDQERFYWIRILKKYNDYFETSKESWKMSTSKIQARFVKKLAMATLNFFKTASVFMIDSFSPTINQLTPLQIAAYDGDVDFFRKVKERTTNLNLTSTHLEVDPIHLAAYRGHVELCRHFLEESENKKIIGKCQSTSLHYAALGGHFEVFKLFYAFAEVKNPKLSGRENTPFHLAAYKGNLDICKFIIEREDDKNPENNMGNTPLHCAAMHGHHDICCLIINSVTNINTTNNHGFTPFGFAAKYGHLDICKLILRNIGEKNPRNDFNGETFLHDAAWYGRFDICKLIIENINEKNPGNVRGDTPLHLAASGGHLNECKLIMANIADIHPKNLNGDTPMDLAKERNNIYIMQLFRLANI